LAHSQEIETGRLNKPTVVPLNGRKCRTCINYLEDEFYCLLECSLYNELRKTYIKPYYWKRPNMPKLIERMTTENITKIRYLSKCATKAFEIRKKTLFLLSMPFTLPCI